MLSKETYLKILGIDEDVQLTPLEMADKMNITFFPIIEKETSREVRDFGILLKKTFDELKVNIVPYDQALERLPLRKIIRNVCKLIINDCIYIVKKIFGLTETNYFHGFQSFRYVLNRTKIKKGISVICIGEQKLENLPMQYIYSFKDSSIVTILDFPKHIQDTSSFDDHYETAMNLFVHHMTNIVIGTNAHKWILYNFNASHPVYPIDGNFTEHILQSLVPKIVAPIRPYKLNEFIIKKGGFSARDDFHKPFVEQIVRGAEKFGLTKLYPKGKKIDDLPFRNKFFKWVGKVHLDHRNGMSFGFLAHQLPSKISVLEKVRSDVQDFFVVDGIPCISLTLNGEKYSMKVPDVWVLTQKSGSDKTHVNPDNDLIKIGLVNGEMIIQTQDGKDIDTTYKPSFDTKVILAHALGNAIIASIQYFLDTNSNFTKRFETQGISLSHWHGYIRPDLVPKGFFVHGVSNPHVACSSPQSAVYAISGKLEAYIQSLALHEEYFGDIHIEPQHGTNVNFFSLEELSDYLINNPEASVLGNKYYSLYNK